jgi:hypothetical protein
VYATLGKWDKVSNIRGFMKEKALKRIPGCSWIEVGQELHVFIASDKSHPEKAEIYVILDLLGFEMYYAKSKTLYSSPCNTINLTSLKEFQM